MGFIRPVGPHKALKGLIRRLGPYKALDGLIRPFKGLIRAFPYEPFKRVIQPGALGILCSSREDL